MQRKRRARKSRRGVVALWWLVAVAAFLFPLGYAVRATYVYLSGYWSVARYGVSQDIPAWRDAAGGHVEGPVAGLSDNEEWDEALGYCTCTWPIWVSPQGDAYLKSPAVAGMVLGYSGAGAVAVVTALVWNGRRLARRERAFAGR